MEYAKKRDEFASFYWIPSRAGPHQVGAVRASDPKDKHTSVRPKTAAMRDLARLIQLRGLGCVKTEWRKELIECISSDDD